MLALRSVKARALVPVGLLVFGCGDADYEGESAGAGYVDTITQEMTTKCGADKYQGPQGADVSKWQGDFNWTAAGVVFGFARVSDGLNYPDSWFDANWQKMKAAGILRGCYQFFRPAQDAVAQANMVVQKVGRLGTGDLPCVIDVEATDGQTPATVASRVQTWLDVVERGTGKKPIIYTGPYFWESNVRSTAFGGYPLWIAHYGPSCPSIPNGWSNWTFWQYCDGNTQYCSNGKGWDRNVFNGTLDELKGFAGQPAAPTYAAAYVTQSFPLASSALEMTSGDVIPSFITLKNVGTATWDSNTRLGTTEPRDRASAFADGSWLGPNRPAAVSGRVAPGESFQFDFSLRAPSAPGTYFEFFGVVQEGVTWFPTPPDNQLQAQILVREAEGSGGAAGAGAGGRAGAPGAAGAASGGAAGEMGSGGSAWGTGASANLGGTPGRAGTAGSDSGQATRVVGGEEDEGCACRAAGTASGSSKAGWVALLALLGWHARRRRRPAGKR
jgi:lysozyme